MSNFNMFDFLKGFQTESKKEITNKYIQGLINKDEFIRRMREIDKK